MSEYIMESVPLPIIREESQLVMRGELVRCRDCDDFDPRDEECGGRNWCERMSFEVEPEGFCAWGERKVVGE